MDEINLRNVLYTAINFYGPSHQAVVAIEEMSELQKEFCKMMRTKKAVGDNSLKPLNLDAIVEEMADVLIMLDQFMMAYNCANDVQKIVNEKLVRLHERLKNDGCENLLNYERQ